MIFVTLGSQKFQFNRLLKSVDQLVESGEIADEVFAQTGYSDYEPKYYRYKKFLDRDEFADVIAKSDIVITHGGTGAIIGAVKRRKKVIVVPRRAQYGEHVDDHQLQLVGQFRELNLICECDDCDKLNEALKTVKRTTYNNYQSNTQTIIDNIEKFIEGHKKMDNLLKSIILTPFNLLYRINPEIELKILFRLKCGYKLNLNKPKTYNEKIQWIKLNDHNLLMPKCCDKYVVREYVENKGCGGILNELLWEGYDPEEMPPFDELPDKFVIKVTHGSTFNIICTDKSKLDRKDVIEKCKKWLKAKFLEAYGEWFYGIEKPRVIIEKFLEDGNGRLRDYKVYCFNGVPRYISVDSGDANGTHFKDIYDTDWNLIHGYEMAYPNSGIPVEKPGALYELLKYAAILSEDFLHARTDFYMVEGKVIFGEITFSNSAGFGRVEPKEFALKMGEYLKLPIKKNGNEHRKAYHEEGIDY